MEATLIVKGGMTDVGDEPGGEEPAESLASFHIIRIGLGSVDNDGS